jgi:ABC-type polysaccharide/polyol phosphate transport system ATPase subunit
LSRVRAGEINVERVSRCFRIRDEPIVTLREALIRRGKVAWREVWALRDVSFAVEPGESVGLVGRNGSGKTTLLRLLAGIFKPTGGRLAVGGSVGSLLELGAGFHPDFTGRENVYLNGSIHGLTRKYMRQQMDEIIAFSELEEFIDLPVRTYSAGMYMRLGFAVATHLRADVLLLDEVFAVGDEAFQRKCFGKIFEFKQGGGTILFVSHDASAVERLCERAVLFHAGQVVCDGSTAEALKRYQTLLAEEADPEERQAGLREWGSGEVRITAVRLLDSEGGERNQFASGEPLVLELELEAEKEVQPPQVAVEFRDSGVLLGRAVKDTGPLGGVESGSLSLVFELDRLPLAEGSFTLSVAVSDSSEKHLFHRVDDVAAFQVHADRDDVRGTVLLDGRWSAAGQPRLRRRVSG